MTKERHAPAYPAELRDRGVRLFREQRSEYSSDTAACRAIAPKLGCSSDSCAVTNYFTGRARKSRVYPGRS